MTWRRARRLVVAWPGRPLTGVGVSLDAALWTGTCRMGSWRCGGLPIKQVKDTLAQHWHSTGGRELGAELAYSLAVKATEKAIEL